MSFQPPAPVEKLASFAELLAWAMALWGDTNGGLLSDVRVKAKRARSVQTFSIGMSTLGTLDFGTYPNNAHAQWLLRLGLARRADAATTLDDIDTRTPGYKSANSANDWYRGEGLGPEYFEIFCRTTGIPEAICRYLRQRYYTFKFLERPKRFQSIVFDQERVQDAIDSCAQEVHAGRFLAAPPPQAVWDAKSGEPLSAWSSDGAKAETALGWRGHKTESPFPERTLETTLSHAGLANRVGPDAWTLGAEMVLGSVVLDAGICDFQGIDLRTVVVNGLGELSSAASHPPLIENTRQSIPIPVPNRPKAHLVNWHAPIIDQGNILTLDLMRSDYWTSEATKLVVEQLQHAIVDGQIDLMTLPRRLDVHLVVISADDNKLLLTRRGSHVATEPSTWMITVGESMDWDRDRMDGTELPHPVNTARFCLTEHDELNLPRELADAAEFTLVALATEWVEMLVNLVVIARVPGLTVERAKGYFRRGENVRLDAIDFELNSCLELLRRNDFSGSTAHGTAAPISDISRAALLVALRAADTEFTFE